MGNGKKWTCENIIKKFHQVSELEIQQRLAELWELLVQDKSQFQSSQKLLGVSAKDMNRPSFQKMLNAIERREIDLVLVTELSRFSRSTKDFANLQVFLEDHQCKFMSIRENFDTSGAAGSMVLNLMYPLLNLKGDKPLKGFRTHS